jgi:hypothetical protein
MATSPGVNGCFRTNSTLAGPTTATEARKLHTPSRSSAGTFRIRSNVKATSFAAKGAPSDQETPGRMVNRSFRLSGLQS